MITPELITRLEKALRLEYDVNPANVTEYPELDNTGNVIGTAYILNNGEFQYSGGLVDAHVYIEYDDGDTLEERIETYEELEHWTKR